MSLILLATPATTLKTTTITTRFFFFTTNPDSLSLLASLYNYIMLCFQRFAVETGFSFDYFEAKREQNLNA